MYTADKTIEIGGVKSDARKLPYQLLPPKALEEVVKVLSYGENEYGARNWEKGISYDRLFGAVQRHMWAFKKGETIDPESGLPHLAHATCTCLFMLSFFIGEHDNSSRKEIL